MTEAVSTVEFALDRLVDGARRETPVVGGVSLIDLVLAYETSKGFDIPGAYDGLIIGHFQFGDLTLYLSGNAAGVWPGLGRVALLGCNCGEVGCWPLLASIRQTDEYVMWDQFEQPHRKGWDHVGGASGRVDTPTSVALAVHDGAGSRTHVGLTDWWAVVDDDASPARHRQRPRPPRCRR